MRIFLVFFCAFFVSFSSFAIDKITDAELSSHHQLYRLCNDFESCIYSLQRMIRREWKPDIKYFEYDLTTRVRVFMNETFIVEKTEVIHSSGNLNFDSYARKAVEPFIGSRIFDAMFNSKDKTKLNTFILEFSTRDNT